MDITWNHPVDLHFFTTTIQGWPRLQFEVWRLDEHGGREVCTFQFLCLCMTTTFTPQEVTFVLIFYASIAPVRCVADGYSFVHIPTQAGHHSIECPVWRPCGSMREEVACTPPFSRLDVFQYLVLNVESHLSICSRNYTSSAARTSAFYRRRASIEKQEYYLQYCQGTDCFCAVERANECLPISNFFFLALPTICSNRTSAFAYHRRRSEPFTWISTSC